MNHTKQNLRPPAASLPGRIDVPGSLRYAASTLIFLLLLFADWTCAAADPTPGDVDLSFNPGSAIDGTISEIAIQPDGKVLIAGNFITVAGTMRGGVARLNPDGSLDTSFLNGLTGANSSVTCVAVQADGKVLIGGYFTSVNGVSRNGIARLHMNGSLDTGFLNGIAGVGGDNASVFTLAVQADGRVLIGGRFTSVNGESRVNVARLWGAPPNGVPTISAQPQNRTNVVGTTATFSVTADGQTPLSYQWRLNGAAITGATNANLSLSNIGSNNAGSYQVVITNLLGSVTSAPPAVLTVIMPPSITVQPASQTVIGGTTARFQVTAVGSPPLSYHWRKDGLNLSDTARVTGAASNLLAISSVQAADAGAYEVVVSNAAGSVTSAPPAILAVEQVGVWSQNKVFGPNVPGYPFAGLYQFTDLTIGDNVQVTSSNISHLVIQVSGTLTMGSNAVIRVRNGYYTNAPRVSILSFTTNNLATAGVDAGGVRLYPDAFGKGGDGGNGEDGYGISMFSGVNIHVGGGGGGGGGSAVANRETADRVFMGGEETPARQGWGMG
jgi:uncharacterized delta-60 repeat protein